MNIKKEFNDWIKKQPEVKIADIVRIRIITNNQIEKFRKELKNLEEKK